MSLDRGGVASSDSLFWVTWVIEQYAQFDAAMPRLRKVRGTRIPRVQIRRGVVRWEKHQRIEEVQHDVLGLECKCGEGISRRLRLAAVAENHFGEIDAPSVVSI